MKKAVVTGGAGFIGHIVIKHLLDNTDWDIVSIDRLDYSGNLNRISHMLDGYDSAIKQRVKIIYHDLKSEINNLISKEIEDANYILHLAASSHVDRSIIEPMVFVQDNVVATCNLLEFATKMNNLESFIYFSTDEVFGPAPKGVFFKEWDRYNSTNPYSASKAGGEELAVAFQNTYDLPVIITHTMNVFGERQHPEKYIPNTIYKGLMNEKVLVHSDSEKKNPGSRHYIYVTDVAKAVLFILENKEKVFDSSLDKYGAKCPKLNIPGSKELSNLDIVDLISKYINKEINYELIDFHSARPGHDLRYSLDGNLMKEMGWQPKVSIEERINQVVTWTLENSRWLKS